MHVNLASVYNPCAIIPWLTKEPINEFMRRDRALLTFMLLYGAASLTHFMHNAVYLKLYPNMPTWLTPFGVLTSWIVIAGTGAVGYWLIRKGLTVVGLAAIALYAALGFAGLDHYVIAPVTAHTLAMNATIVGEAIAASVLLVATAWTAFRVTTVRSDHRRDYLRHTWRTRSPEGGRSSSPQK